MIVSTQVFRMLEALNDCIDKAGKGEMRGILFLKAAEEHGLVVTMADAVEDPADTARPLDDHQPDLQDGLFAP